MVHYCPRGARGATVSAGSLYLQGSWFESRRAHKKGNRRFTTPLYILFCNPLQKLLGDLTDIG